VKREEVPNDSGEWVDVSRFPRSTREAFPDERGQWFEGPEGDSLAPLWVGLAVIIATLIIAWAVAAA
jgi:hypothetical protein